jgi:large subunit ribosomal protein L3
MNGLIGKKMGMTQVFTENGRVVPVTVIQAGPCHVVQRKTQAKDGYEAIQLGFLEIAEKKVSKPQLTHFKKHNSPNFRFLREFRLEEGQEAKEGEVYKANLFKPEEKITVIGTSKGRGFSGVMKHWGFAGFSSSHGVHESFRGPGSIGQNQWPGHVFKGKKMSGHYGCDQITVHNLKVVKVDPERNLVLVRGAVPGARNSIVLLKKQ